MFSLPGRERSTSIRANLQTTSLLAVLAGYLLLLTANRQLAQQLVITRHSRAVAAAGEQFAPFTTPGNGGSSRRGLQQGLASFSSPSRLIWLVPQQGKGGPPILPAGVAFDGFIKVPGLLQAADRQAASTPAPVIFRHNGRTYLTSSLRLFVQGELQRMRFLDDITDEAEQERTIFLLLVALAGLAALFTSMLLRLVIHRALKPLERFSATLKRVTSRTLSDERLSAEQPAELQPMAASFNDLLERMANSWEHQRTFVNAVSHELRTPITLILGYITRLQRRATNLEPAQQEQLAQVHGEATRMGRLVSDLLEIAREDAGRLEVRQEPTDAWSPLEAVHQRLQAQLGERLQLQPRPEGDLEVLGDAERLEQCLTNLVENAVKYAPPATPIELAAECRGDLVVLHVRDHGPGVPAADRRRIFRRFERGSQTGNQPGSGIGLAVVATLMQRMGGSVRVEAAPGGGADFLLSLSTMAAAASRAAAEQGGEPNAVTAPARSPYRPSWLSSF